MKLKIPTIVGQNISRSFLILHCIWRISLAVLLCTVQISAQQGQQPPPEFPIGTFLYPNEVHINEIFESLDESGLNYVVAKPDQHTLNRPIKLMAQKEDSVNDYVPYYSKGYYTRWEAERDEVALLVTGIKHPVDAGWTQYLYGQKEYYIDAWCWASEMNVGHNVDTLIWGPNYRQDKKYRWFGLPNWPITSKTVFRMALTDAEQYPGTTPVCRISVFYRYKWEEGTTTGYTSETFAELILTKSNFPTEDFYTFDLVYQYPSELLETMIYKVPDSLYNIESIKITDTDPLTGIEFRVDWFDVGKLYVDYVEVYDQLIGSQFLTSPSLVADRIKEYTNTYENWNSLEYWFAYEEPNTIDSYTPFHIVDSLIQNYPGINKRKPLSTVIYESWNGQVNGDWHMQKFVELAKPHTLMIDWYPFWEDYTADEGYHWLRSMFEFADIAQPNFWYVAQAFGEKLDPGFEDYCYWRKPSAEELNASIMLALAHGSKGVMLWQFSSWWSGAPEILCDNQIVYFDALVGEDGTPTPLYFYVMDNLVPRLKGKLGSTLLSLDYTHHFINMEYQEGPPPEEENVYDYLSIQHYGMSYYWHAGFFTGQNQPDNKHFLLTNLRTGYPVIAELIVSNNTNFQNVSFTDIEGGEGRVDTTIGYNSSITYYETMPEGEGRLYRVAPVIKYGGKLCYNETVPDGTTLNDVMIIQNGAMLTIAGNYTANADIIVKNGSIVTTGNGKITFQGGHKLIIEGTAAVYGTIAHKLTLDFSTPAGNGIVVDSAASLTISNCIVENALIGIKTELYANYLNAQSVDLIDCGNSSITILGQMGGGETPPPQIKNCTIINSTYAISVSNLSQITIQYNSITDTDLGIFLSNVASPIIYSNVIVSNKLSMAGIFLESSGGNINVNTISGHSNGIHLGNSSPSIGANNIYDNKFHGIYVGSNSLPNMEQNLVGNPPDVYPLSGYNDIKENGGITIGGPLDNDGSEIFLNNSNVILESGCNSICDDRSPGGEHPPYNTKLLMNGIGLQQIEVFAVGNYWCDNPLYPLEERFGNLLVHLDPVLPAPCDWESGGEELVMRSSSGELIDTLYSVPAAIPELTETELKYAEAEEYFITADYVNANLLYQEIINSQVPEEEKYNAQIRKYEIGKLTNQSPAFFNAMGTTFETIAASTTDTLQKKIFNQLATLSLVGEEEYIPAIGEFDEIIQQNPNTEEAVYAEIDAITTALLVEGDSTLGKGTLAKYLVKTSDDYLSKLDGILRKHFGIEKEETGEEQIPEEYTLYQNYPNPFNPVTTIKYDLPNPGDVSLIIYDILGRKVRTLVNEQQQPGRFGVSFDASNLPDGKSGLASGIYIYQLITGNYVNAKKMILLK